MLYRTLPIISLLIVALAATAGAQNNITIPQYSVVPVQIDTGLNSSVNQVGDTFTATCMGAQCSGFPAGTRFLGTVTFVQPRTNTQTAMMSVSFAKVQLPNGTVMPIRGVLTSLDASAVVCCPDTGRMMQIAERRQDTNSFIGYNSGCGIVIGTVTNCTFTGAVQGTGGNCWVNCIQLNNNKMFRDVDILPCTTFGIALQDNVTFPASAMVVMPSSQGAGPSGQQPAQGQMQNQQGMQSQSNIQNQSNMQGQMQNDMVSQTGTQDQPGMMNQGAMQGAGPTQSGVSGQQPMSQSWPDYQLQNNQTPNDTSSAASEGAGPSRCPMLIAFSSAAPYMTKDGVLMVPFRSIANALGMMFKFDNQMNALSVDTPGGSIRQMAGSNWATMGDQTRAISAQSRIMGGVLYVPWDFVQMVSGRRVSWDPATSVVQLQ